MAVQHMDHSGQSADVWVSFPLQYGQSQLKAHRFVASEEAPGSKSKAPLFSRRCGGQEDADDRLRVLGDGGGQGQLDIDIESAMSAHQNVAAAYRSLELSNEALGKALALRDQARDEHEYAAATIRAAERELA